MELTGIFHTRIYHAAYGMAQSAGTAINLESWTQVENAQT